MNQPSQYKPILSRDRPQYHTYKIHKDEEVKVETTKGLDDLLVFGYSSKLFPPDQISAKIWKEQHLIPWKGDDNIMLDKYDCRFELSTLSDFDSDSWNINYKLSEEEERLESNLDHERYLDLNKKPVKDQEDEELKRLRASIENGNHQVPFKYDDQCGDQTEDNEDEKPFTAPESLELPAEMEIPATEKMNAVIEKTALFISQQGLQMEIVLKAKQAQNSQFQFLQFQHYLNPYYKHMVEKIREGKYLCQKQDDKNKEEEAVEEESESSDDEGGDYLHPSLFASSQKKSENQLKIEAAQTIDHNHPLAKLIEKGKTAQRVKEIEMKMQQEPGKTSENPADSQILSDHSQILPPPPDLQMLVEDVAKRVAFEGNVAEIQLLACANPSYGFLQPWHELHPYYQLRKLTWMRASLPPPPPEEPEAPPPPPPPEDAADKSGGNLPVSFSIKMTSQPKLASRFCELLADDESDEEEANVAMTTTPSLPKAPEVVSKSPEVAPSTSPSNNGTEVVKKRKFTAVTSSGESASIDEIRQKQAERRQRALLFIEAKRLEKEQQQVDLKDQSEDIFDLSEEKPEIKRKLDDCSSKKNKKSKKSKKKNHTRDRHKSKKNHSNRKHLSDENSKRRKVDLSEGEITS